MLKLPPPGARLKLNAALAAHGVVPVEIRRKVESEATTLRATHLFTWRLSREDRMRIDEAQSHLANFKKADQRECRIWPFRAKRALRYV